MKKVITYGTYDYLHQGHINLLKNAKALGDYLIVGITSDEYDRYRGKLDVRQSLSERIEAVQKTGLADMIIIEEYQGQKISDIQKYNVDIFTVGSDWVGAFDYLSDFCEVVYLPRTEGISSTQLRRESHSIIRLGIIGHTNPSRRFIQDCAKVNGVIIEGIFSEDQKSAAEIAQACEIRCFESKESLYKACDAVYIVDRIDRRAAMIMDALRNGLHVACESPVALRVEDAKECFAYARGRELILFDAMKTRCFPGYQHLILLLKSGIIGEIKDLEVSFSQKLKQVDYASLNKYQGSIYDLGGYVFLPMVQILGRDVSEMHFFTTRENEFDVFTKGVFKYPHAVASFKAGLGVKTEGQLIITGTKGYVFVPAPWWKTDYFEIRYEDLRETKKYFWEYQGEGFRYELMEFARRIYNHVYEDNRFSAGDSEAVIRPIEWFDKGNYSLF